MTRGCFACTTGKGVAQDSCQNPCIGQSHGEILGPQEELLLLNAPFSWENRSKTRKVRKVVGEGAKQQMCSESVLDRCNTRVHRCTLGLHRSKTPSEHICSGTPKHVSHPLLTTFRTFLVFDRFPRKAASQLLVL